MQILVAPCLLIPAQTLGECLGLGFFFVGSVTSAPVLLKGDGTFIAENNVMESVATLHNLQSVLEPFNLVDIFDQLAISSTLQGPSQLVL